VLVQYISDPFTASLSLLSLRGTKCRSNLRGGRWAMVRLLRSARNDDDSVSLVTSLIKVKESLITTVRIVTISERDEVQYPSAGEV